MGYQYKEIENVRLRNNGVLRIKLAQMIYVSRQVIDNLWGAKLFIAKLLFLCNFFNYESFKFFCCRSCH